VKAFVLAAGHATRLRPLTDTHAQMSVACSQVADVLASVDLKAMLQLHRARQPVAASGVYSVPDPACYGIVTVSLDGQTQEFVEKPLRAKSNLVGTPENYRFAQATWPGI
jgi:NDP-sugar pyrophosphorylase family protein